MMHAAANAMAGMLGLGIFVLFFAGVVYMLLRKGAKEEAAAHAMIPFKENGSHD